MGRRSRRSGRFGRQCGWAPAPRSLPGARLHACRQIQLELKMRWQILPLAKKSPVLHLIFSWFYSFFCAPAFRIFLHIETKPRLTLCGSASGILRRRFQERQAESFGARATEALTFAKKVT